MKDLKILLYEYGITITELSQKLKMSRPTLTTYADIYFNHQEGLKEKNKLMFERLFPSKRLTKEEFDNELKSIEGLIMRDEFLGTMGMEPEESDMISSTLFSLRDLYTKTDDKESLNHFLQSIVCNYEAPMINHFRNYLLVMCNIMDLKKFSKDEQAILVELYKIETIENNLKLDEKYYNLLLKKIKEEQEFKKILDVEAKKMIDEGIMEKEIKIGDKSIKININ